MPRGEGRAQVTAFSDIEDFGVSGKQNGMPGYLTASKINRTWIEVWLTVFLGGGNTTFTVMITVLG